MSACAQSGRAGAATHRPLGKSLVKCLQPDDRSFRPELASLVERRRWVVRDPALGFTSAASMGLPLAGRGHLLVLRPLLSPTAGTFLSPAGLSGGVLPAGHGSVLDPVSGRPALQPVPATLPPSPAVGVPAHRYAPCPRWPHPGPGVCFLGRGPADRESLGCGLDGGMLP